MTQNKPYLIGLTGGIASGKSNISRALKKEGAVVIDADHLSRVLTQEGGRALDKIRESFGDSVFDGPMLNRSRLSALVFRDRKRLKILNDIMHPMVYDDITAEIQRHTLEAALVIEVPLLFETGWHQYCDEVWCVYAPVRVQVLRLRRRNGLSLHEALRRVRAQMPGREKCRRADYCISTTGTRRQSADSALALWRDAIRRAGDA